MPPCTKVSTDNELLASVCRSREFTEEILMSKRVMSQTNDENEALMVGTNFKVGRKLGAGNFGELRLGKIDPGPRTRTRNLLVKTSLIFLNIVQKAKIW